MRIGKVLLGAGLAVGAVVLAPVVAPAAAAAGATALAAAGSAVATVGSAVASSTVGMAVGSGMAAVGGAVGSAAGAVGLSSVATVAGTTAGATAVGTIATTGAVGVSSAVSGASKIHKASGIADEARNIYTNSRKHFDEVEAKTNERLEKLGRQKIEIWNKFSEFERLFNKIQNLEISGEVKLDKSLCLDADKLNQVHVLAISAGNVIKDGVISLTAGQLIGAASATGITSIATASTGTAIASLHGAAAYNASMAALGGGALSAGGLGMAGGAVVANALAFAPAIAVGGLFLNSKGSKSLKNAEGSKEEAEKLAKEMATAEQSLRKIDLLSQKLCNELDKYSVILDNLLTWLKELTDRECNAELYSKLEMTKCFATYRVVEILYSLTTTELYSTKDSQVEIHSAEINGAIESAGANWEEYSAVA